MKRLSFVRILLFKKNSFPIFTVQALPVLLFFGFAPETHASPADKDTVIVKTGIVSERISADWKNALVSRMSGERIDSLSRLQRDLTPEEKAWKMLITGKTAQWNTFRDSLLVPFGDVEVNDTIYVLLGYRGSDDGFTYGYQTVCLDLSALNSAYGKAGLPENDNRIDRIFAHEYTHLLHKLWTKKNKLNLETYKDSILWECLYEGIGMYRSLNPRWMPVKGNLPEVSKKALENLYPVFIDRLTRIETADSLTAGEKEQLNKNLSRGSVDQKWGAFPVAIWLALEANGDHTKLANWINKGPAAVIELAKKYLPAEQRQKFMVTFR